MSVRDLYEAGGRGGFQEHAQPRAPLVAANAAELDLLHRRDGLAQPALARPAGRETALHLGIALQPRD